MDTYNIKNFDEYPTKVKQKVNNFQSKYDFIKNFSYANAAEQKKDIDEAKALSNEIKSDIGDFIQKQTNERVHQEQQNIAAKKLKEKQENMAANAIGSIKDLVKKAEFDAAELKVDEIKKLAEDNPDLSFDALIEEQTQFISESKDKFFEEQRAKMKTADYIETKWKKGEKIVSTKELVDTGNEEAQGLADNHFPGVSETLLVVGKFQLRKMSWEDNWEISDKITVKPEEPKEEPSEEKAKSEAKPKEEKEEKPETV